jgi:hypothetical protein
LFEQVDPHSEASRSATTIKSFLISQLQRGDDRDGYFRWVTPLTLIAGTPDPDRWHPSQRARMRAILSQRRTQNAEASQLSGSRCLNVAEQSATLYRAVRSATSRGYNAVVPRMMCAFLVAIGINAQGPFVQNAMSSTQVMSPTVVASWYVQQEANQPNRLQLVVLWRGTPAWWRQPGCIGSCGDADPTVQYGSVHLTIRYDPVKRIATVNGRDIVLHADNVLYVDGVDAPGGPTAFRTSHIDPRMPGTFGQIGTMLGNSQAILDYMQCRARSGIATVDAALATMCLTNLGRQ